MRRVERMVGGRVKPYNQDRDSGWAAHLEWLADRPDRRHQHPSRQDWTVLALIVLVIVTAGYALAHAAGFLIAHLGWVVLIAPVLWGVAVTLILITMDAPNPPRSRR